MGRGGHFYLLETRAVSSQSLSNTHTSFPQALTRPHHQERVTRQTQTRSHCRVKKSTVAERKKENTQRRGRYQKVLFVVVVVVVKDQLPHTFTPEHSKAKQPRTHKQKDGKKERLLSPIHLSLLLTHPGSARQCSTPGSCRNRRAHRRQPRHAGRWHQRP